MKNLLVLIIAFFPSFAFAVCDACAKAALDAATATMTANISATTSVVASNGAAITAMANVNSANSAALQTQLATLSQQELTAIDGMASKITLQLASIAKETDIGMNNLILNIEKLAVSERNYEDANYLVRTFGPLSKPLSGKLNLPRSEYLERGFEVKEVFKSNFIEGMDEWLSNPADEKSRSIEQAALLSEKDNFDITPFMQKKVLSPLELEKMKSLLQLLVEPNPEREMTLEEAQANPLKLTQAINQKQKKIRQQVVHSVLVESVLDKAPFILTNESWSTNYLTFDEDFDGMVSFSQFYEAETLGKLTSAEWYKDIAKLTDTGLIREQVHQGNTTNMLLAEILKAERNETRLVAIKALAGSGD